MAITLNGTTGVTTPGVSVSGSTVLGTMGSSVITSGTSVASTSGTSIDYTSIPSWVKRITVMLSGVSLSGSSNILIQIGAGSITSTGYVGSAGIQSTSPTTNVAQYTTGFGVSVAGSASNATYGNVQICLVGSNIWLSSGAYGYNNTYLGTSGGSVTLSGTLDRVRITTVNGTDTFDAGTVNILYE